MTNQGRGLRSPCTPRQGYHPCTRSATHNWIEQGCFRMMGEETKNSTTGTMKTIKIAVGKINFPTAYFFVFPGCYASGWRRNAARPVEVPVAPPTRNVAIIFCQRVSACFVLVGSNPSVSPSGCPLPLHKGGFRFSLFQRDIVGCIGQETSASGSRDEIPCGCRANGPA